MSDIRMEEVVIRIRASGRTASGKTQRLAEAVEAVLDLLDLDDKSVFIGEDNELMKRIDSDEFQRTYVDPNAVPLAMTIQHIPVARIGDSNG